ncbi:hypothetical protein HDF14_001463 [Edaphobacter lichenicola]|uniref:Uncharacterized protein n=1 Tax=Tunturiibacter gelidiferens TaxID=3069689 RepID=A0A9X0QCG8_9BACT|nr:hypothetical protein [Edaphobacter lichenicola]
MGILILTTLPAILTFVIASFDASPRDRYDCRKESLSAPTLETLELSQTIAGSRR